MFKFVFAGTRGNCGHSQDIFATSCYDSVFVAVTTLNGGKILSSSRDTEIDLVNFGRGGDGGANFYGYFCCLLVRERQLVQTYCWHAMVT